MLLQREQTNPRDIALNTHARKHARKQARSHLALVDVLVALIKVGLDTVPVVDLDLSPDLPHRRADGLERTVLR